MKNLSGLKSNGYALFLLFGLLKGFSVLGGYDGETLLNNEYNEHEFLAACRTGNVEAVQYFLNQEGFDPDEQLISGVNKGPVGGLFLAAQNGHHKVVEILVAAEVDLNLVRGDGATALLVAAQCGHHEVVKILVKAGADLNLTLKDGATAFFLAAKYGHHEVVNTLLKAGADSNLALKGGMTALLVAAKYGHQEVVKILAEDGADLNLALKDGTTAILVAARYGHPEVVKILAEAEAEADLDLALNDGATALFMAAQYGHPEVVKNLVENGANPFLKWKHEFIFSATPQEQAQYRRPLKLGRLCVDMAKWQRYSTIIEMLNKAEKEWKMIHPPERKFHFFRRKKKNDPVSAVGESNPTEQAPPLSVNAAFQRLSLNKDQ